MGIRWGWFLILGLAACGPDVGTVQFGESQQAIRNGTRAPQTVQLTDGQILAIGWLHPAGSPSQNFCTATLVGPRIVATAKHCIENGNGRSVAFGMGLLPRDPAISLTVESAHPHPQVDAAILILADDATERLPQVEPIPFNRQRLDSDLIGQEVEAAGFGETYERGRVGRFFATVEVTAIRANEVVVDGRGEQGLCFGDSGGPVISVIDGVGAAVLGVESWGDPSCVGVDHLTRLDSVSDWIDETTSEATRPPDTECEDLSQSGQCTDELMERCDGGRYIRIDCAAEGLQCRVGDTGNRVGCFEYDLCADVGSIGICDGNTVVRCRFGEVVYDDCAMQDLRCHADGGGAFCTDAPIPSGSMDDPVESDDPTEAMSDSVPANETDPSNDEIDGEGSPEDEVEVDALGDESSAGGTGCTTGPGRPLHRPPLSLTIGLMGLILWRRRRR